MMRSIALKVDSLIRKAMTVYRTSNLILYVGEEELAEIDKALPSRARTFRGVPVVPVAKKSYLNIHPDSPHV